MDEVALDTAYEQLEELDPATFEAKAGSILHGCVFFPSILSVSSIFGRERVGAFLGLGLGLPRPRRLFDTRASFALPFRPLFVTCLV